MISHWNFVQKYSFLAVFVSALSVITNISHCSRFYREFILLRLHFFRFIFSFSTIQITNMISLLAILSWIYPFTFAIFPFHIFLLDYSKIVLSRHSLRSFKALIFFKSFKFLIIIDTY